MIKYIYTKIKCDFILILRYKTNFITWQIVSLIMVGGIIAGVSSFVPSYLVGSTSLSLAIGYFIYLLYGWTVNSAATEFLSSATAGYLEREFVTPFSPVAVTSVRFISGIILGVIPSLFLILILVFLFRIPISIPVTLIGIIFILIGIETIFFIGIGYILAGLSLWIKRLDALLGALRALFMALSLYAGGVNVPYFFKFFPYTQVIIMLKKILVSNLSIHYLLNDLVLLSFTSLLFFIIGIYFFKIIFKKLVLEKGTLFYY